ncbi:aromatic acid exporter family protein [Streptomyces thermolineatus]|uniref:Aromatic acid exporter family protein n=1 Tax=Streptomyces thermolineatus TaxID=44033 RepID=A0ABN3KPM7_9ACTN
MPAVPEPVVQIVRRSREPVVVQTVRSTVAAVLAYATALWLTDIKAPLTAPLTALLVVQVTLYATLTTGIRRVNSVVVGVVIAVGFSSMVGLSWWSLGLIILASLAVGHFVRVGEFVPEVAISAMLVLGVSSAQATALERVEETLIGAAVGLLLNGLFAPPVWVQSAGEAIEDLASRLAGLLRRLGDELAAETSVERSAERLHEARRLDNEITRVDAELSQAEESLRFNPRVREGLLTRVVLRTGLDTLEICAVLMRTVSRALTDLAKERTDEPMFAEPVCSAVKELFGHVAGAVHSFGQLVTSSASANAEEAETRLSAELAASRAARDRVADLLLVQVQDHPRQWQLHGSLLADVDRLLDELDVEKRSLRLAEELDRYSREQGPSGPVARRLGRLLRRRRTRRRS